MSNFFFKPTLWALLPLLRWWKCVISFPCSSYRLCCGGFGNHNIIMGERDWDGSHMCWCHAVLQGHPAVGCTFRVCSTASCLNWQQWAYPFGNRYKKWLGQSHRLHAPLVHQGNNGLIQRLRSGPWVWITLTLGRGGWSVSSHGSTAPCTRFDKLKQTEGHRADSDTKHPRQNRSVSPPRSNPNNQHAFSLRSAGRRPMSPSQTLKEKMTLPVCHFG